MNEQMQNDSQVEGQPAEMVPTPPADQQPGKGKMKLEKKVYESRAEKQKDFIIGAGIFIGLNVLLFIISIAVSWVAVLLTQNSTTEVVSSIPVILNCLFYPLSLLINLVVLIYFMIRRTWIGIGMLGTFAFLLLLVVVLGIIASIICFASLGGLQ